MTESAIRGIDKSAASPDYSKMFADLATAFRSGRTRDLAWRNGQLKALERMMSDR